MWWRRLAALGLIVIAFLWSFSDNLNGNDSFGPSLGRSVLIGGAVVLVMWPRFQANQRRRDEAEAAKREEATPAPMDPDRGRASNEHTDPARPWHDGS